MAETIRHGLPLLAAGQAQKEVTHNEALLAIDRQLQLAVETRALAAPPAAPAAGANYIVATAATGAWTDHSGDVATFDGFGWIFTVPVKGCLAWIADEGVFAVNGNGWSVGGWPVSSLNIAGRDVLGAAPVAILAPAGGGVVDDQGRVALAAIITALRQQGIIL